MTMKNDASLFTENLAKAAEQCQRLMQNFIARQKLPPYHESPDLAHIANAFSDVFAHAWTDPARMLETQWQWWGDALQLAQRTSQQFLGGEAAPTIQPDPKDRRFKDKAWQESIVFDYMKQSYLLAAKYLQQSVRGVEGVEPHTAQKVDFYTRQFIDAMSPSNFLLTNPEVLRTTLETGGENLVHGLEHLLEDLDRGDGMPRISMTNLEAFEVGRNLAVTPGKVVYRNDLMELIQYTPLTEKTYQTPILAIPAWINKYYILDLQPENSVVRFMLEQGYTVFVISWVNPNERLAQKSFEDYMLEGPLAALDAIEEATGRRQVNVVGYCLGGTLLAITLAYLKAVGEEDRVASATFLTTMVDFSESGELGIFIDEEQLRALESRMSEKGYLDGKEMALTFNMLRANDLIWSFVVNNYLLGRDPFPFDLLYWNADSTRMPAAMHSYYLRNMYQENKLVQPGALTLAGVPIDLRTITTPAYILSTREDHIAPWKSTYAATQLYRGDTTFVLAASGHIAGVINPPGKNKYSHWVNAAQPPSPDEWLTSAQEHPGSWWPHWQKWAERYAGPKVPARIPGDGALPAIEDAPGSYVRVKS